MFVAMFSILYPIWYCLIYSFNDGYDAMRGQLYGLPRKFTFENYKAIFMIKGLTEAYAVSIARTIVGTAVSTFFTAMVAYAFSKKYLIGRRLYVTLGMISLFFSGGLIPFFMLIRYLHLFDNFWVYIIPVMFNFYYLIIFQSFFRELPAAIEESAKIDGANDFFIFLRLILPLSKPVLATIALYVGVFHWNDYFYGVIYINNTHLQPIQTFLYRIISQNDVSYFILPPVDAVQRKVTSQSVQYATMIATTLPIVCVYPFLQKYFVKGMMIGSVKG
jgi:putative aldouronate transport system permease protein